MQVLKEVPSVFFPFQYGTIGSLLAGLMIPVYGSNAIGMIQNDFSHHDLNVDEGDIAEISKYIDNFNDTNLTQVANAIFTHINKEFYGSLKSFFQGEVWQVDSSLSKILEKKEEFRDAILLFVFSVPIFPVSELMRSIMTDFHIFEPDEVYIEMQSIMNEFFSETPKCQRHYLAWKVLDSLSSEKQQNIISLIEKKVPFICDGCGKDIKDIPSPFITRVEVYPSRNVNFDYSDIDDKDYEKEIASVLESATSKTEKESNKSVWTEYRLFLCSTCRNIFVKRIEAGEFI